VTIHDSQLQSVTDAMLTEAATQSDLCGAFINSALGSVERHARHATPARLGRLRTQALWLASLSRQLTAALDHAGAPHPLPSQPVEPF
jgi:hypothetical protein